MGEEGSSKTEGIKKNLDLADCFSPKGFLAFSGSKGLSLRNFYSLESFFSIVETVIDI
jgi:hypothetical protein